MKINVNDCLKLDSFRNAVVLAGADSLDRRVKSVSVFDEADLGMGVERNGEKDQMVLTHFWTCSNDIDVQKKMSMLKEKRDTLLAELDTQIKVSNATTFIEA